MNSKKKIRILFVLYLLFVLRVIVFKYPYYRLARIVENWDAAEFWHGIGRANFDWFRTIKMYITYWHKTEIHSFSNLVGNVLIFIPFGYLLPRAWKIAEHFLVSLIVITGFVIGIETFQLWSSFGVFDVDDILLNCIGGLIGYLFFIIIKKIKLFREKKRLTK